jgi:protein-disulfide isomerase
MRKSQTQKRRQMAVCPLVSIVAVAIAIVMIVGGSTLSYYGIAEAIPQQQLSLRNLILQGSPLLGKSSAPVTIVEFRDFQCDKCPRFAKYTEPQVNQIYIQTGKVNLVFKYFPVYDPDSTPAAMAAQCVNDQGKFWSYYGLLFKNQGPPNFGWANNDNLRSLRLNYLE